MASSLISYPVIGGFSGFIGGFILALAFVSKGMPCTAASNASTWGIGFFLDCGFSLFEWMWKGFGLGLIGMVGGIATGSYLKPK